MSLRVTQGMMHLNMMRNLNRNMGQMASLQEQTATGRKLNKPSDDPVGITYSVRYRTEISGNEQYQKNVDSAISWLDFNDTVLGQANEVLQRVKEFNYAIGVNSTLDINLSGNQVFGADDPAGTGNNVFSVLDRVIAALDNGTHSAVTSEIPNIEASMDRLINARSEIGARTNRVELVQNRLADMEINLTDMQSKTEDADYEKLLIDAQINENIYQASLSVGAKIVSKSLVDFLS
ncbi:flagellin [Paenibacillus sp. MCAF20]